jgi:hypothetical protein
MGRARRLINAGGTDEHFVLLPPLFRSGARFERTVEKSVEDRGFDVGARCLAGRLAAGAVAAFWSLLARFLRAGVDCISVDAVAAFVSVCLHGMTSLDGEWLFAGFVCRDRAQRWQGCRRRRRQRDGDRFFEDVAKGAGQAWRLREQVCERAVHVVLSGRLFAGRKGDEQHARLN